MRLDDSDFSTGHAAAAVGADFAGRVFDYTVTVSVDRKVSADLGADATALAHTDLANDDHADFDLLAAK